MNEEENSQPKQPSERTYKVEQMVRAAEKGAAQQINRLEVLAELIRQSEENIKQESVNKSLTE